MCGDIWAGAMRCADAVHVWAKLTAQRGLMYIVYSDFRMTFKSRTNANNKKEKRNDVESIYLNYDVVFVVEWRRGFRADIRFFLEKIHVFSCTIG